jgi:hypothetical protein
LHEGGEVDVVGGGGNDGGGFAIEGELVADVGVGGICADGIVGFYVETVGVLAVGVGLI